MANDVANGTVNGGRRRRRGRTRAVPLVAVLVAALSTGTTPGARQAAAGSPPARGGQMTGGTTAGRPAEGPALERLTVIPPEGVSPAVDRAAAAVSHRGEAHTTAFTGHPQVAVGGTPMAGGALPDAGSPGASPRSGAGEPAPGAGYAWPLLPPPAVLTPFRAPSHAYGPGHRGVDLAGRSGQPVLAARAGTVVFAGPVAGHGVVSVQHDDGLRTTYEPVSPTVAAGALVRAGDALGRLEPGHAGCPAEAACLHWGVRRDRLDYLDPLVLLGPVRVRLLPVPDPWPDGDPPAPEPA